MKFPRERISASLINAYFDCPRGFYLTVILELLPEEGPALEIGSIFDFMFKTYHQNKNWLKEAKKKYITSKSNKDTIKNFGTARGLMETYLEDPDKFVKPKFDIKFEVPIEHPITHEVLEGVVLKGYLDGEDEKRIKELKSTAKPYTREKVKNAIQGKIYSYAKFQLLKEMWPVDWIVVGKINKEVQRFTTTYTIDDFVKLFETIKQFIKDVEDEKFSVNPNHPSYCPCRKL